MTDGKWDNWEELVTWATWTVIEYLTHGKPLRSAIFTVLDVARRAQFKEKAP